MVDVINIVLVACGTVLDTSFAVYCFVLRTVLFVLHLVASKSYTTVQLISKIPKIQHGYLVLLIVTA